MSIAHVLEWDETGKVCNKCGEPATHPHLDDHLDWCDKCCVDSIEAAIPQADGYSGDD